MANVNPPDSRPSLVKVPQNYPMVPEPGKISILFDANYNDLYHKFDANNYDGGNGFGFSQPYVYRYPTEREIGVLGIGSKVDDVVRVTKFIASGRGALFVAKQFLLQGFQPFDETNIYNPTEVVLTAASNLASGLLSAPKRHVDTSAGLLGGLAQLVGIGISRNSPPPSTVAAGNGQGGSTAGSLFGGFSLLGSGNNREAEVLPVQNYGEGAGLLRAKTATKARSILQAKWGTATGGIGGGILGYITGIAKSIIPQVFGSDKQNFKQRADEEAYDWMVKFYNDNTAKDLSANSKLSINIFGISLNGGSQLANRQKTQQEQSYKQKYYNDTSAGSFIYNKDEVFVSNGEESSDIKKKYEFFIKNVDNKTSDPDSPVSVVNAGLKKVIDSIGFSKIYKTDITNKDNWLLLSGNPTKQGYDRLHDIASTPSNMKNNPNSVESTYYDNSVRTLDSIINPTRNVGLAGNGRPDKINTLTILDDDKKVKENLLAGYEEWKPYEDDLIAFFFYDVVNKKYIPFRATVRGINESNNGLWDELRFIGRADAIYSYTGFNRNLAFTFTVVVNSLLELYPVWKRINYLVSAVKPSGYTSIVQNDKIKNNFIIPPMFMLTIGDLYKYQPVVLTTITMNIPDSAIWETVPENSSEDWTYMANMIKSTVPKSRIGQVPREIEVSVACNVLEKERPRVGGTHFGHAPIDSDNFQVIGDKDQPYLPKIEDFSENLRDFLPANFEG